MNVKLILNIFIALLEMIAETNTSFMLVILAAIWFLVIFGTTALFVGLRHFAQLTHEEILNLNKIS